MDKNHITGLKTIHDINIPTSIFQNRDFSVLEAMVVFLREHYVLNYHQIGEILNRNERTIWTVYNRAKKKRGNGK